MVVATVTAVCIWASPGADRFTGNIDAAIDSYKDIRAEVRERLKVKANAHAYDDHVVITRDSIVSDSATYDPKLTHMHFGGSGKVCATVDRSAWPSGAQERALVYCDSGYCIAVPSVCGNVARVTVTQERKRREGEKGTSAPGGTEASSAHDVAQPAQQKVEQQGAAIQPEPASETTTRAEPVERTFENGAGGNRIFVTIGPPMYYAPQIVFLQRPITPPVPEPRTWLMFLSGVAPVMWLARRGMRWKQA